MVWLPASYGPDGELLYERDANGNTKAYVWLDGRPLARIDNNAQIYYYHVDHLGTPWAMTDGSGTVVWKANYEPFGKATVTTSTIENNLRLPGQYFDRETGMQYNYFRDYDPSSGRYIEADPIGILRQSSDPLFAAYAQLDLHAGLNQLYSYVNGNPLSRKDPKGLDGFDDLYQYIQQPGFDPGRPAENRPGDTITLCRLRCAVDFYNPIPDTVSEKASEKALGAVAAEFLKKYNKGKGAYDLGNCLHTCQQQFKSCTQ